MTIEREEAGVLIALCDGCGERRILDLEPEHEGGEASEAELAEALEVIGWQRGKPECQRFGYGGFGDRYRETYHHDLCGDCQTDEPGPHPIFRHRPARPSVGDAFANDPCDEWPRDLVFAAVGLRSDCGHPRSDPPASCGFCAAGYPIGSTTPAWRRA